MWNEAIVIGHLGKDPEIRTTQSGTTIASMSVATTDRWTDKNSGEKKEKTEWHRVSVFGKLAEVAERFCQKGTLVAIRGAIRTRKWTDQSGADKYSTEIVVDGFDSRLKILGGGIQREEQPQRQAAASSGKAKAATDAELDDEIPF
jgi:single-strand DNA-binding protein